MWTQRLPGPVVGCIALLALFKMEGMSIAIPVLSALLLAAAAAPFRLPNRPIIVWSARILLLGFVVVTNLSRSVDILNVFDTRTMTWFGELFAAEMALACWLTGWGRDALMRPLWLSAHSPSQSHQR